ncbi:hypothetical protein [Desulfosporosinus sp. SB140]|uniref:hypothetical protein n=1 Tax=Desulfosporosinus paludis TaxID=3115649 RepID=UPI00388F47C3
MFEIQNVSLELEGKDGVQILKDINLKFDNKKIYVVTGPNVLFRCMKLLLPNNGQ